MTAKCLQASTRIWLKRETLPLNGSFNSREEAKSHVQGWLYYYNGRRPHSKLGMKSPNEYDVQLLNSIWWGFYRDSKFLFCNPIPILTRVVKTVWDRVNKSVKEICWNMCVGAIVFFCHVESEVRESTVVIQTLEIICDKSWAKLTYRSRRLFWWISLTVK